ncbi:hypothetical protein Vi05172_g9719 [Venturia inaequalis]|nr:hypothetical protein Vi05172_g9719 [Venturia inaequalis]
MKDQRSMLAHEEAWQVDERPGDSRLAIKNDNDTASAMRAHADAEDDCDSNEALHCLGQPK